MKKIILLAFAAIISVAAIAQNSTDSVPKELTREQKKAQKEAIRLAEFKETEQLINSQKFVLEANYRSGRTGARFYVTSSLNFIKIDSTNITIQIGSNSRIGYNGVGGVTVVGKIQRYKVDTNEKRKTFFIRINMMGSTGSYDIFMNISSSGSTTATVTGLYPGGIVYDGVLVPLEKSIIYTGSPSY
jgi:hypothetical protein